LCKEQIEDNRLINVLKLNQEQKNTMLESVVKHHLLPRVEPIIKPKTDLKPNEMMLYKSMCMISDNTMFGKELIINEMTKDVHPKQRRSESRKRLENLWDTYIQMRTKAKENEDLTHLFSALCWH
jgi:hypothetical protein